MAKHKIRSTQRHAMRHLILAVMVLGWGVAMSWGWQSSASQSPRSARTRQSKGHAAAADKSDSSSSLSEGSGKRDPFKLPEYATGNGRGGGGGEGYTEALPPGGVLPPGKRGLIISQLKLEGVVRQQASNKMTALVVDHRNLAYFLHDNDSVYNGVVSKITPDSVYFKENVLDSKGRVTTREVVKRLGAAPGEGR